MNNNLITKDLDGDEIDEASNYAQECVQNHLDNQGESVEITVEEGEVYVNADQELIDACNDYSEFCNDLQNMFDEKFNYQAKMILDRKGLAN